ncbi:MAG: 50S ribosomal protein L21e [Candidatus ainarchaeum sp.]|nr:50S ribosomal protein L21e [Candidatus ainarchaeum sp.]
MVKRSKGFLSKGTKSTRKKRTLTANDFVKPFKPGEHVVISIGPYFKGLPHPRYNGVGGQVLRKQGTAYIVRIKDGGLEKTLVVSPVHMLKLGAKKSRKKVGA